MHPDHMKYLIDLCLYFVGLFFFNYKYDVKKIFHNIGRAYKTI